MRRSLFVWLGAPAVCAGHDCLAAQATLRQRDSVTLATIRAELLDAAGPSGFVASPDGALLAYGVAVPLRETLRRHGDKHAYEVWLADIRTAHARVIVGRHFGDNGYTDLTWSPDGKFLAMVRDEGRGFRILIWSRRLDRLVLQTPCLDRPRVGPAQIAPTWVTASQLVFASDSFPCILDASLRYAASGLHAGVNDAVRVWMAKGQGRAATASVLESGLPPDTASFPRAALWAADVGKAHVRRMAIGPFETLSPSPAGSAIALLRRTSLDVPAPNIPYSVADEHYHYRLTVLPVSGEQTGRATTVGADVLPGTIQWSPDGRRVSVIERGAESANPCLVVYLVASMYRERRMCGAIGRDSSQSTTDIYAIAARTQQATHWLDPENLVVRLRRNVSDPAGAPLPHDRADWYLVGHGGDSLRSYTRVLSTVPDTLITVRGRTFAFTADTVQELHIDPRSGTVSAVARATFHGQRILRLATLIVDEAGAHARIVVADSTAPNHSGETAIDVSIDSGAHTRVATSPADEQVLYSWTNFRHSLSVSARINSDDPVFVVRGDDGVPQTLVRERPTHNPAIFPQRTMMYRSTSGAQLVATVTFPAGYDSTRRYPLVVMVYPGRVMTSTTGARLRALAVDGLMSAEDPTPYASLGYIVLMPSMPYEFGSDSHDEPIESLTPGVLPAIDGLTGHGVVDSACVAVLGQSFGGYAVYGLLTRTTRFRAGVALSAPSDFIASYGVYMPTARYRQRADAEDQYTLMEAEAGAPNLHGLPWENPDVYRRNSPFFHVDAIATPLLIIQGDQDIVPVTQGEQMYRALFRLGRRATLVRYWGEDHVIAGYYNEIDAFARIAAWLRTYLSRPQCGSS